MQFSEKLFFQKLTESALVHFQKNKVLIYFNIFLIKMHQNRFRETREINF
jgi:hypothetical protein